MSTTVPRFCFQLTISCLLGIIALSGCSSSARVLPKAAVAGKVSYAKSFPGGEIIFRHTTGELTVIKFEDDGEYTASVPTGKNDVLVRSQTSSVEKNARPGAQMEIFTNHIPLRYSDFTTSKLEIDVKPEDNDFDIELKD